MNESSIHDDNSKNIDINSEKMGKKNLKRNIDWNNKYYEQFNVSAIWKQSLWIKQTDVNYELSIKKYAQLINKWIKSNGSQNCTHIHDDGFSCWNDEIQFEPDNILNQMTLST